MKKLLICLISSVTLLAGCASMNTTAPTTQNPAQLLVKFCPLVQAVNTQIAGFPGVSQVVVDKLNVVNPIVAAVCSNTKTVNIDNLRDLAKNGMPLLLDIVALSPLAATPQGQSIVVGINLAQLILPEIIAAMPQ